MASLQLSWGLTQTLDGTLNIGKELLLAASADNVPLLALAACEKFGATIAMSQLTQLKIEKLLREQAKTPIQKFLLAQIGYVKGGAIEALSKSAEGIRFLSLAAMLVSTMNTFDAAKILEKLVNASAKDKELSPTIYHLKDLLDVLEPSLNRARFFDEVIGCQFLLESPNDLDLETIRVPPPQAVASLVEGLRILHRIGDANAKTLHITTSRYAPWVLAFIRWSIDEPPLWHDRKHELVKNQTKSPVTVYVSREEQYSPSMTLEIKQGYDEMTDLFAATLQDLSEFEVSATGMISIESYARLRMKGLCRSHQVTKDAIVQLLPFAVYLVRSRFDNVSLFDNNTKSCEDAVKLADIYFTNAFPEVDAINLVLRKFLDEDAFDLSCLDVSTNGIEHEWTRRYGEWLTPNKIRRETPPIFPGELCFLVADVLAISLLSFQVLSRSATAEPLVLFQSPSSRSSWSFSAQIAGILKSPNDPFPEEYQRREVLDLVLSYTLSLLGHKVSAHDLVESWVASSHKGQVVVPQLFLSSRPSSNFFALLAVFPGQLMHRDYKRQVFKSILCNSSKLALDQNSELVPPDSSVSNAFPNESIRWKLSANVDYLALEMGWTRNDCTTTPLNALKLLPLSVIVRQCVHLPQKKASHQHNVLKLSPMGIIASTNSQSPLGVFAVHGNDGLRLLALATAGDQHNKLGKKVLINQGACLDCVMKICKILEIRIVIL